MPRNAHGTSPDGMSDRVLMRSLRQALLQAETALIERRKDVARAELQWARALVNEVERRGFTPPLFPPEPMVRRAGSR